MSGRLYRSGDDLARQIRETALPGGAIALWYLGQEGFLLKTDGATLLFDPYLTDSVDHLPDIAPGFWVRSYEPPMRPEQLDAIDVVFCTHEHMDHMDPDTIRIIARTCRTTRFVVPAPSVPLLRSWDILDDRILGARAGVSLDLGGGIHAVPVAAAHPDFHRDSAGDYAELGYIVRTDGITLFHGGDLSLYPELTEHLRSFRPDIALLPINGGDWKRTRSGVIGNIGFREAVDLGADIDADLLVPMHFDLYAVNSENPAFFVDYITRVYPDRKYHIFKPGERFVYFKER